MLRPAGRCILVIYTSINNHDSILIIKCLIRPKHLSLVSQAKGSEIKCHLTSPNPSCWHIRPGEIKCARVVFIIEKESNSVFIFMDTHSHFLNFLIKWMNTTASIWPDEMVAEKLNIIFVGYVVAFCFNFMNWWLMKL